MNNQQSELEAIQQGVTLDERLLKMSHQANESHISFEDYYSIEDLSNKINEHNYSK